MHLKRKTFKCISVQEKVLILHQSFLTLHHTMTKKHWYNDADPECNIPTCLF